jgi:uncharacterized membrane protein YraQ (UPF0718 family)
MHLLFRKEELEKEEAQMLLPTPEVKRPLWQTALFFAVMVAILVFANWGKPVQAVGFWASVYAVKWPITALAGAGLGTMLAIWFRLPWWQVALAAVATTVTSFGFPHQPMVPFAVGAIALSILTSRDDGEAGEWFASTWGYAKQILPLLLFGVLVAGALLGRPGQEGLIPSRWVIKLVGGNSLGANLFASVVGAFMYFATLTEVPILQGLIGNGMGQGPALALLLAGPALSLPSMLVINSIMGTKKTVAFVALVVVMATITGLLFGALA